MANVTIIPAQPQVQTVTTSGQQPQSAQASSLPTGSIVSGTIAGKDANGNFLLRTSQGTFSLQSNTPLTYNSDVEVRIDTASAAGTTARILTVNGEPFASFAAPDAQTSDSVSSSLLSNTPQTSTTAAPANAPTSAPATQASAAPATAPIPLPATAIRALVVSAPPPETTTASNPASTNTPPLTAGTSVVIRVSEAPETTTQQSLTTPTAPVVNESTGNAPASSGVQAQTQAQELANAQTPATVASLVAPQQDVLQQNTPTPTPPITNVQTQAVVVEEPSNNAATAEPANTATTPNSAAAQTPVITVTAQPQASAASLYAAYQQTANTGAANAGQASATTPAPQQTAPSTPSAPAPSSASTPSTIPAQVISTNSNGLVSLQTPLGTVTVKADALPQLPLLAAGANVSIELPATSPLAIILTPSGLGSAPAALTELASSWQSLSDIVSTVAGTNPTAATALLARLPQLGTDFIASTASFISAMTQGDVRKLLGDNVIDSLKQNGRNDLVEKFTSELGSLNQAFTQTPDRQTTAWQPLFLPFVYQEELQQARMYVKRDAPKKSGTAGGKATGDTRFVVEVDMSELGPLQLDGLVRTKEQNTSFDLMIRSFIAFPKEDREAISAIYTNAAELTGFKGTLTFQVTHDFPVKPLEEMLAGSPRSITV